MQSEFDMLHHVSGWSDLAAASVGDSFVLVPGPQHAEGPGVYFSADVPRFTAAEGAVKGVAAVVRIDTPSAIGWWRTKAGIARKFGRAITWHSLGRSVRCFVCALSIVDGVRYLDCDWQFV